MVGVGIGAVVLLLVGAIVGATFLRSTEQERVQTYDDAQDADAARREESQSTPLDERVGDTGPGSDRSGEAPPVVASDPRRSTTVDRDDTTSPDAAENPTSTVAITTAAPVVDPHARLVDTVAGDRTQVEQLVGSWVPQVSSKRVGLEADGIVYDDAAILRDHEAMRQQHGALLLWSGDYSTFKEGSFWVSVVPVPFSTPEAANQWCDGAVPDRNACFAKLLSHTAGHQGATQQRG